MHDRLKVGEAKPICPLIICGGHNYEPALKIFGTYRIGYDKTAYINFFEKRVYVCVMYVVCLSCFGVCSLLPFGHLMVKG